MIPTLICYPTSIKDIHYDDNDNANRTPQKQVCMMRESHKLFSIIVIPLLLSVYIISFVSFFS